MCAILLSKLFHYLDDNSSCRTGKQSSVYLYGVHPPPHLEPSEVASKGGATFQSQHVPGGRGGEGGVQCTQLSAGEHLPRDPRQQSSRPGEVRATGDVHTLRVGRREARRGSDESRSSNKA